MCSKTFKKCDISKCHASCCAWVPLNLNFIQRHSDKIQRPILAIDEVFRDKFGKNIIVQCITYIEDIPKELRASATNEKGYIDPLKQLCPFLTEDCKCAVYDVRPEICKVYGTTCEPDNSFTCHYHLGKNYSCPQNISLQRNLLNNIKYFMRDIYSNDKLLREMLPGVPKTILYDNLKKRHLI